MQVKNKPDCLGFSAILPLSQAKSYAPEGVHPTCPQSSEMRLRGQMKQEKFFLSPSSGMDEKSILP
ncbi:MAG: hypothetical protein UEU47_11120 [Oscillospiraceae bacterium]|nr:hypothetical protein [Oscillospiraceae bacterium]